MHRRSFLHTLSALPVLFTGFGKPVPQKPKPKDHTMSAWNSWGWDDAGETAHGYAIGTFPNIDSPVAPSSVPGNALQISGSDVTGCCLNADGTISVWGFHKLNKPGGGFASAFGSQFDASPWDPVLSATQLTYADAAGAVEISQSHTATFWRKSDNTIWAVGLNQGGIFGNGETTSTYHATPVQVFSGNAVQFSSNNNAGTMVLDSLGRLWWAGELFRGMQGDGVIYGGTARQFTFTQVPGIGPVSKFWTSGLCIFALTVAGSLYCWGENIHGELGLGDTTKRHAPTIAPALPSSVSDIVCAEGGWNYFLLTSGALYVTGYNLSGGAGILGTGDTSTGHFTTPTLSASGLAISQLVHTNADPFVGGVITSDGKLWLTGENNSGQIDYTQTPTGTFTNTITFAGPVQQAFLLGDQSVFALVPSPKGRAWSFVLG